MADIFGMAGTAVGCVSLLLGILALALNSWLVQLDYGISSGLWEVCIKQHCVKFSAIGTGLPELNAIDAVKAMLFLGIFAQLGAVVCAVLKIVLKKDGLQLLSGVLGFAAGFFFMIGFAVFAGEVGKSGVDYGAAFALDIVAWLLAWVAGGLLIAPKFVSKSD